MKYSPVDVELLRVVFAAKACNYYLAGCPEIELYSDCKSLKGLLDKSIPDILNPRQQRMVEKLQYYNFDVTHISGSNNKIADLQETFGRSPITQ